MASPTPSPKLGNALSTASSIADIGSTALNAITSISDQKKRRMFEQNLALLSADQQKKLDEQLLRANSESQRLQILADNLTRLNVQRITSTADFYAQQEKKKRNEQMLIGALLIIFAGAAVYLIVKKF